jgi:pimeloyl-ACP methyl ester carboxylesterase
MANIPSIIAGGYFAVLALALVWNLASTTIAGLYAVARARRIVTEPPPFEPKIVVTLVHGTWARRAMWTVPGSLLCQSLSHAVESPIAFQRFVWSGRNSISARRSAVKKLVEHLHSLVKQWPQARLYVLAHSHGGNVAFQALADPLLNERVAGIVCLSTPFLTVGPRNLGPVGATALWWLPVVAIFYGGMFAVEQVTTANTDSLAGVLLVVAIASGFLTSRLLTRLSTSVRESLQYPVVDPSKLLILRAAGDEAAAVFGLTHVISWTAGQIWLLTSDTLGRIVETVERWREMLTHHWRLTALATVFLLAFCVVVLLSPQSVENSVWLQGLVALAGLTLLLLFATLSRGGLAAALLGRITLAAIAAPFLVVIAFLGIAVGPELLAAGLVFQVTAEPAPPGRWVIWQIAASPDNADATTGMMHSESYQNPQALAILGTWFATVERELAMRRVPSNNHLEPTR